MMLFTIVDLITGTFILYEGRDVFNLMMTSLHLIECGDNTFSERSREEPNSVEEVVFCSVFLCLLLN